MARAYKLTWREKERRWRKFYRGQYYYFPIKPGETKLESYRRCWQEWIKKRAEIDLGGKTPDQESWEVIAERCRVKMQELQAKDTEENREEWLTHYRYLVGAKRNIEYGIPWFEGMDPKTFPLSRFFGVNWVPSDDPPPWKTTADDPALEDKSIHGTVGRYLQMKIGQTEGTKQGNGIQATLSKGRYDTLRVALEEFAGFSGPERPMEAVNSALLGKYREHLLEKVKEGRSPEYAKSQLGIVRQFVRWAWENELVELPRVLGSREFSLPTVRKAIQVFTPEEVKQVLEASPESLKLYLLLMLNCGMTQHDIAALRQEEVDWTAGRITRKRSKTANHAGVPEVCYPLWEETFRLLVKYRNDGSKGHQELALVNRDGGLLKTETIVGGKVKKSDNIRSAYNRVLVKLDIPRERQKPLKLLRKTAASLLGSHAEYGRYAQHFLGHSPRTIADKHYVRPSQDAFDRAISWLGSVLVPTAEG